ncbi:MAG: BMP family ABC transporter substrate-binding protein [Candidatus Faecousia sp.]|nr:BMP family ABC transporter substrate-binding protein [Clostridiales bacterium]MCI6937214.1 BMP family ABC transporter substrate-binding protein [Clostridiales bacterium]MDD5882910.1 BMP family ABC transporter substrate-binding protein [Bacillota bacterium]MDY4598916.1 BMP family ABC transporter substrate-binding protein [Candidatus Faecousia sp.]
MKKILAVLLVLAMTLGLAACGGSSAPAATEAPAAPAATEGPAAAPAETEAAATEAPAASADDIPDEMTSADGKYQIAFVTDVGQLKDKSFNQGTFDGVKLYAANAGKSYKYYQPAGGDQATDDDRYDAMKLAADNGAEVIVCAGFMQGTALAKAAAEFPDVKFVFIDGWALGMNNVAGICFREEQCGYLAGYAAVMDGYTKLGFCGGGGGTNAACDRYGYGFVQGADAAAAELGVQVEMNYSWLYGSSFQASNELQTMAAGWYTNGTEVIFACGGSMFQSIAAAASAEDAAVIGVDVDQSFESPTVITSAMKGIGEAAQQALKAAETEDSWNAFIGDGNTAITLGAAEGAVGLPTATWSLEGWTVADYEAKLADIVSGKVVVDNADVPEPASTANVTMNIVK